MDELKSYSNRRLELADLVRALLHLARGRGDQQAEKQARELLARLASDRFRLAVVGQFSRGKSTLMNALLGGAYLPMGALPMTSVITTVRYGSSPRAIVRRRASGLGVEVPLTQVAAYVDQASSTRAEQQVTSVEVEIPAEILRLGFEFIDTPGVGSTAEANSAATRRFLPQADAVIFVTGFDSPLTQAESRFLADAARYTAKLFLVVNKRDLVSGRDASSVLDFVRCRLVEDLELGEQRLFTLSALEALGAVIAGDDQRLSGSGLPRLHADLREFLTSGKTRLVLLNAADRAVRLALSQQRDLLLGRLTLDGGPDPDSVLAAFEVRMTDLHRQRTALLGKITRYAGATLPGLLVDRDSAWQANLHELLMASTAGLSTAEADSGRTSDLLESGRVRLEQAGREATRNWLDRRTGEVLDLLTSVAADEIGALLALAQSPGAIGAQIADLAAEADQPELPGWSAGDLPDLLIRPPAWTVVAEQPRRSRLRPGPHEAGIDDRLNAALDTAVDRFTTRARTAFEAAAREWAGRLDEQAGQQMRESAERFRRSLRTLPRDEDLAALDRLIARLAAFQAVLDTAPSGVDVSDKIVAPGSGSDVTAEGCTVCQRMEETLTSQLLGDQFRLATREDEQERHTRSGGFCPTHTWQYAAVASPLGISAGYARLAASVADSLESLSRQKLPATNLARGVAALTPAAGKCPVCGALADCERTAITEIISLVAPITSPLCLRHLAATLAGIADPSVARELLNALAAALRRDSEDMRAFALKREAYRSGLVTEEEAHAHLDALRRLAGRSRLVQPWADQEPA